MIEYFENTAWTVKSSLSSSLFKNLEKIFECPWEDKKQLCLLFIKSRLYLCSILCSPACGAGPASLSAHSLVERSGDLGDEDRFPGGRPLAWEPSPTNGSWLLFPDLCPSRNRMACVKIYRGEHQLLGLVNREEMREAGGSDQILQIADGESNMSHLCSTKVTQATRGEGLRGSRAR